MTIFANFLASAKSIDVTPEATALDRRIVLEIQKKIDQGDAVRPAGFAGVDAVQTLVASGASAGTFDITVGVRLSNNSAVQVDVSGIDFDASPAAIQIAVNAAVGAVLPGYTNDDIDVSGAGTAEAADTVFTYSGASVNGRNQPLSTVDGTGLTGGGSEDFTDTTVGQTDRDVWAVIEASSLVGFGGTPPVQGGSLPTLTKIIDPATQSFSSATLRAIATETAVQDYIPGLETALLNAMGLTPEPPATSNS